MSKAFDAELVPQGLVAGYLHLPAIHFVDIQPKCLLGICDMPPFLPCFDLEVGGEALQYPSAFR